MSKKKKKNKELKTSNKNYMVHFFLKEMLIYYNVYNIFFYARSMYYSILYYIITCYIQQVHYAQCTIDTRAVACVVTKIENRFICYDNTTIIQSIDPWIN